MVRSIDEGAYTFWMAGYYDDFMAARTVPDDENTPAVKWYSSKTHQGNPINGWATLNPRYTYAWVERGDGDSARFNNSSVASSIQYTFNKGVSEWASLDINRNNPGKWDGLAQLEYPDSLTNANRQKYDGGTGIIGGSTKAYETDTANSNYAAVEGYLLLCNGYDTSKRYYVATGSNDSTFGRAAMFDPMYNGGGISPFLEPESGMPMSSAVALLAAPTKIVRTHLTGVYSGEVPYWDALNNGAPKAALMPIESPSGKPFLVTEIYQNATTSHDVIMSYDGTLNSKGDGDIFTIRICPMAVDTTNARIRLRIGCEGTAFTSAVGGDTGYTHAAIDYEITPIAFQEMTTYAGTSMDSLWDDYDFIMDYSAGTYDIVKNGASVSTGNAIGNTSAGVKFQAADMYGWELDAKKAAKKVTVLIDRVGLIRPLNDYPLSTTEMPPVIDFDCTMVNNSSSSLSITVVDDDAQLELLSFFNQSSYSEWSLLMFHNRIDRPLWRGGVTGMSYSQDASRRTPTIKISASDYFANLNTQIPTWEMGQGGEGDSTAQVAYNRSEAQNELNSYYFGASLLESANQDLGFNEVQDGTGTWKWHLDSRMRNRSAHPIQMYLGEDINGPNEAYDNWDDAITGGHATADTAYRSIHSRWIKDLKLSPWFMHLFSKIDQDPQNIVERDQKSYGSNRNGYSSISTTASNFNPGDSTLTINGVAKNLASAGSIEFVSDDGFVDSGVYSGISTTNTATNCIVRVYEERFIADPNAGTYDPRSTFGLTQTFGASPGIRYKMLLLVPQTAYTNWNDVTLAYTSTLPAGTVSIEGASSSFVNGTYSLNANELTPATANNYSTSITINGVDYWVYKMRKLDTQYGRHGKFKWIGESNSPTGVVSPSTAWTLLETPSTTNASLISRSDTYNNDYRVNSEYTGITLKYGQTVLNIPTTNFFQRSHASGSNFAIRNLDTNDYKHIWILWSDMRNDGSADADNSYRKKQFGLMTPYSGNYELSLGIADTNISATEDRERFVDLKIGEDVDIWEIDATTDPITGNTWSSATNGSNSESNSKYHNWEDKAGSFIIIDSSKFFNLNTVSNNGRTGQDSGGRREIGDYLVETEGFPVLIDNYWVKAPTTYQNIVNASSWNSNYKYLLNDVTTLATEIKVDDKIIQLTDASVIPPLDTQVGQIRSEEKKTIFHFATYSGSWDGTGYALNNKSVSFAADGAGFVEITDVSGLGYRIGETFRAGHKITIRGSTTTPSIDGDYTIAHVNAVNPAVPYAATTTLTIAIDAGVTITAGTGKLDALNSRPLRTLLSLGVPVKDTTTAGEWDGTGYGATNGAFILTYAGSAGSIPSPANEAEIGISLDPDNQNSYTDALVYGGLANVFPMRLIMALNGFVENKASGTWWDSEKLRMSYLDCLTKNWLTQSRLYGMHDIGTVPVTKDMATVFADCNSTGRGGRITAITAPSSGSSTFTTSVPHGLLVGDTVTIIDNERISLLGQTKTEVVTAVPANDTFTIPNTTSVAGSGSFGRWRLTNSVDDFGGVNDCRNTTITTIYSSSQSLAGLGGTNGVRQVFSWLMGRDSKPSFRPNYNLNLTFNESNLMVSTLNTQSNKQISNVRVFYGAGGSFVDYPAPNLGQTPRWEILDMPSVTTNAEALAVAKAEYEKNKSAPLSISAEIINFDNNYTMSGLGDMMVNGARYGYIADQSRTIPRTYGTSGSYVEDKAWAWTSIWGGNLFPGMVSALNGRDGDSDFILPMIQRPYSSMYYWYGGASLSYALQVVHIPRNMPKTTVKTPAGSNINADGKLRFVVEVGDGTVDEYASTAINPVFTIRLLDYDWTDSDFVATARSSTSVSVDSNGYYEIDIPSTYWTDRDSFERIVLSVNYDYLLSVAKNRCGTGNLANGSEYGGSPSFGSINGASLFPLGMRKWNASEVNYMGRRSEWYAPRLHICDDINFVPGTQVTYRDTALGLDNEVMGIKQVNWSASGAQRQQVKLQLERDVSRSIQNFASLLLPTTNKGGTQTPGTGTGTSGRGDGDNSKPQGSSTFDWSGFGGTPVAGSWNTSGSMGIQTGTVAGVDFNPMTLVGTGPNVDGTNLSSNSSKTISSNILSSGLSNKIKGSMDFNNDSVLGGNFAVLGQKKPSKPPAKTSGVEGVDSFITASSGDAVMTNNGMSFAGATDVAQAYNEFTTVVRVPANSNSTQANIMGRYTLGAASGVASLDIEVKCVETGATVNTSALLAVGTNASVTLFNGTLEGLNIPNNTIEIKISRVAGLSPDTAQYSSVTLHNIQVGFDSRSVAGDSQSNQMSYSD
jgi:hypothetical protein